MVDLSLLRLAVPIHSPGERDLAREDIARGWKTPGGAGSPAHPAVESRSGWQTPGDGESLPGHGRLLPG